MRNNPKTFLVLNFINDFIVLNGYSPTRREIASKILNGHSNSGQHYIEKLKTDELIKVGEKGHRALSLTIKGKKTLSEWRKSIESHADKTA